MRNFVALASAVLAIGCAAPSEKTEPIERMPGEASPCVAEPAQQYIGQTVGQAAGNTIMAATGAKTFQWVGPNMAVTMDYRLDRVRVSYNEKRVITAIRCG